MDFAAGRQGAAVTDDNYDDIDLATLPDDELAKQMHDDLYDGLADEIVEGTTILLDRGWGADKVLNDALVEGMRIVGIDFRDGILFVPEVLLAANAMKAGMELLRPLLAETGAEPIGSMGTDTPVAVLSDKPRLAFDYFTHLFAQVTNPPLDAIREELVTSLSTTTGPEPNPWTSTPKIGRGLGASAPIRRRGSPRSSGPIATTNRPSVGPGSSRAAADTSTRSAGTDGDA